MRIESAINEGVRSAVCEYLLPNSVLPTTRNTDIRRRNNIIGALLHGIG